jgi:hypothetical protein
MFKVVDRRYPCYNSFGFYSVLLIEDRMADGLGDMSSISYTCLECHSGMCPHVSVVRDHMRTLKKDYLANQTAEDAKKKIKRSKHWLLEDYVPYEELEALYEKTYKGDLPPIVPLTKEEWANFPPIPYKTFKCTDFYALREKSQWDKDRDPSKANEREVNYSYTTRMYYIEDLCRQDKSESCYTDYVRDPKAPNTWGSGIVIPLIRYIKVSVCDYRHDMHLYTCIECTSSSCPHATFVSVRDKHRYSLDLSVNGESKVSELVEIYSKKTMQSWEKRHTKTNKDMHEFTRKCMENNEVVSESEEHVYDITTDSEGEIEFTRRPSKSKPCKKQIKRNKPKKRKLSTSKK